MVEDMGHQASNTDKFQRFPPMNHLIDNVFGNDVLIHFYALVACAAGALKLGVASRANLYLIKQEGYFTNPRTGETWSGHVTTSAVTRLANKILEFIDQEQIPEGRAVVTINAGLYFPNLHLLAGIPRLTTHRFCR